MASRIMFTNKVTGETFQFTSDGTGTGEGKLDPSYIGSEKGMGVIVQEAPGRDGGIVNVTGAKTGAINLAGKIMGTKEEVERQLIAFGRMLLDGEPVEFTSALVTSTVIITSFKPNLEAGLENQVPYSISLIEYRSPTDTELDTNLVNFIPRNDMITRLINRDVLGDIPTEEE